MKQKQSRQNERGINEAVLVKRWCQGDEEAFAELVKSYEKRLGYIIYQMVGNYEEVRDLIQETFIRAHYQCRKLKDAARFSSWLYRIAVNLSIDYSRRLKQRGDQVALESQELRAPFSTDPVRQTESRELAVAVKEAVDSLPPRQKAVVVLNVLHGFTYQETSNIIGCTIGTVKATLFKARCHLRGKLSPFWGNQ